MRERWDLRESGGGEEQFLTGNQNDRHHGVQTSSLNFPNNNNNNPKKKYSERGGGKTEVFQFFFSLFPRSTWDDSRRFTAFLLLLLAWNTRMKHDYSRYRTHTHKHTHRDPSSAVTGPDVKYYPHKNTHRRETGSGRF